MFGRKIMKHVDNSVVTMVAFRTEQCETAGWLTFGYAFEEALTRKAGPSELQVKVMLNPRL